MKFDYIDANRFVDNDTKIIALKASDSVVSLISYSGEKQIFWGSGFIIESHNVSDTFFSTILTSASLLRREFHLNAIADDIKIDVIMYDGKLYVGSIMAYNFHYNIAAIKIQSDIPMPILRLTHLDDSITIDPSKFHLEEKPFQLSPCSTLFNLVPGDTVLALGRYHVEGYKLMIAPGKLCISRCNLDCKELFMASCKISKCGIGGPLINHNGEVIGINFYDASHFTPFLPINIVSKWWEHFKGDGKCFHPWIGIDVINLYAAEVWLLEQITRKFPNIFKGVIVRQVMEESLVTSPEICPNDVIIQCDGKSVQSVLEFFDLIWDKAGKLVVLVVLRPSNGAYLNVNVEVADVGADKFHRWLLPPKPHRLRPSIYP